MSPLEILGIYFVVGLLTAFLSLLHVRFYGWPARDGETLACVVAWPAVWVAVAYVLLDRGLKAVRSR